MRRRAFLAWIASVLPVMARAQSAGSPRRIAVLMGYDDDAVAQERLAVFRRELQAEGWIEGQNVRIDYRFAVSDPARMRAYATELIALSPDVMFASTPQVVGV